MYPRQNFVTHKKKIERRPCVFHFSFFVFFSFKYMYNIEEGGEGQEVYLFVWEEIGGIGRIGVRLGGQRHT